ncbi:MAG: hypothetical protein WC712_13115 [Candidatus Brocadiia bacterium]
MTRRLFAIALLTAVFCCTLSVPKADEPSAEAQALAICKSFGSAAVAYSQTKATQDYWGSGTTDFKPHFSHISPKGGYVYRYFSNSSAPDKNDATKFVYLAVPENLKAGKRAFFISECQIVYEAWLTTNESAKALQDFRPADTKWAFDDNHRIEAQGVVFEELKDPADNAHAAVLTCLSFSSAAIEYSQSREDFCYWGSGTTDFTPHFAHVSPHDGYVFRYFSDSSTPDKNDAIRFIYLAVPVDPMTGKWAYFIDECQVPYEAALTVPDQYIALQELKAAGIKWDKGDKSRLEVPKVAFSIYVGRRAEVIRPRTLPRPANDPASVCKSFGSAAVAYSQTKPTQDYWGSGTSDFTPNFTHVSPRAGFTYKYFSNSSAPDKDDATKFVYLACPENLNGDKMAYYIDETQEVFRSSLLTDETLKALLDLKNENVKWDRDDTTRLGVPGIKFTEQDRITRNESAALSTCKSFGSAAVAYSQTKATQDYWGSGTLDFTPHFTHVTPRGGYKFRYFSNSSAPDKNDATKFVYLAVPVSTSTGQKAYYLDETQTIYVATDPARGNTEILTPAQVTALNAYVDKADSLPNWRIDDRTRLGIPGVEFMWK